MKSAVDLLRLIMAYCLGGMGLRSTSAWAASAGLADLSNVALLRRLRNCGMWMEHLVGQLLGAGAAPVASGHRIRLLDGTTVPKAKREDRENNGLWRLHCAFDLSAERFSFVELTDEKGGERLDRVPVAEGDILIADRGFMHPDPLAHVLKQGADIVVRAGWKGARWLAGNGKPFDILAALAEAAKAGVLDRPVWIARQKTAPLALRLVSASRPTPLKGRGRKLGEPQTGRLRHIQRDAGCRRMGHSCDLTQSRCLAQRRDRRALPRPLAHRRLSA